MINVRAGRTERGLGSVNREGGLEVRKCRAASESFCHLKYYQHRPGAFTIKFMALWSLARIFIAIRDCEKSL